MKTTVELPDDLLISAKQRAAAERRPLRALIEQGLRAVLNDETATPHSGPITWVVVDGGLPADMDLSDREAMMTALARER